ncbi:MAG: Nif3-like dinuclear metal center hexameric protein [Bacteroidaceae bacterium]|nr:Nif3-like dinuclear metal center hexameric protein [Bacteroidaceae bacterium]
MKIGKIIDALEGFAPLPLQDDFDNSGLQVGVTETEATGALLCLDVTEAVVNEAISSGCNLIISHHPLLFTPLKYVTDSDYIGRCVIKAIRNGITIYAAHTNLDNAAQGVNRQIADMLGLTDLAPLQDKGDGNGAGIIGNLPEPVTEVQFLEKVKELFRQSVVKHNGELGRSVSIVALCGGSGAFLIKSAAAQGADLFITGEIGFHRMFGFDGIMKLVEIGHYESEQFTIDLLYNKLGELCSGLKLVKTNVKTNPVNYCI